MKHYTPWYAILTLSLLLINVGFTQLQYEDYEQNRMACSLIDVVPCWIQQYGSGLEDGIDQGQLIYRDNSGDIIIAGYAYKDDEQENMIIMKIATNGDIVWFIEYNGLSNLNDRVSAITIDSLNNVYITGYSFVNKEQSDIITLKLNSQGEKLWIRQYNGDVNSSNLPKAIGIDPNGNVYVTGQVYLTENGFDCILLKYSPDGNLVWQRKYDSDSEQKACGSNLVVSGDSLIYVGAYVEDSSVELKCLQYNSEGNLIWEREIAKSFLEFVSREIYMDLDRFGNIYVSPVIQGYKVHKYSPDGRLLLDIYYSGPGSFSFDYVQGMIVDSLGNLILSGRSYNSNFDILTVKYSSEGVQLWTHLYNGSNFYMESVTGIGFDCNGYLYVSGTHDNKMFILKINPNGVECYTKSYRFRDSNICKVTKSVVDNIGNIFFTGGVGIYSEDNCFLFGIDSSNTQIVEKEYSLGTTSFNTLVDMDLDKEGNVYVTGTDSTIHSRSCFRTIKYSDMGDQLWSNLYTTGISKQSMVDKIVLDTDGNVMVVGHEVDSLNTPSLVIIKYNASGDKIWLINKVLNNINSIDFVDIKIDKYGDNIILYNCRNDTTQNILIYVTKLSCNGTFLWDSCYSMPEYSYNIGNAIECDNYSNVYIVGHSNNSHDSNIMFLLKLSSDGILEMIRMPEFESYKNCESKLIALDNIGNIYMSGYGYNISDDKDIITIKYSPYGDLEWNSFFNNQNSNDEPFSIMVDSIGNIYVAGNTSETSLVIKYMNNGVKDWVSCYSINNSPYSIVQSMKFDVDKNILIAGICKGSIYHLTDIFLAKLTINGDQLYTFTYDGPNQYSNDLLSDFEIDMNGNLYIAGTSNERQSPSFVNNVRSVFNIVKYRMIQTSNANTKTLCPVNFDLKQNFPNPFNPITTIKFDLPKTSDVILTIFDITGRIVEELINDRLSSGYHSITWDAANHSSGVYFYRLQINDFQKVKKCILIK